MVYGERVNLNMDLCRWIWKGVNWERYMSDLRESSSRNAVGMIDNTNAERLLENIMSWIQSANNRRIRIYKRKNAKKLVWWTDELERMKMNIRKLSQLCLEFTSERGSVIENERMRE